MYALLLFPLIPETKASLPPTILVHDIPDCNAWLIKRYKWILDDKSISECYCTPSVSPHSRNKNIIAAYYSGIIPDCNVWLKILHLSKTTEFHSITVGITWNGNEISTGILRIFYCTLLSFYFPKKINYSISLQSMQTNILPNYASGFPFFSRC